MAGSQDSCGRRNLVVHSTRMVLWGRWVSYSIRPLSHLIWSSCRLSRDWGGWMGKWGIRNGGCSLAIANSRWNLSIVFSWTVELDARWLRWSGVNRALRKSMPSTGLHGIIKSWFLIILSLVVVTDFLLQLMSSAIRVSSRLITCSCCVRFLARCGPSLSGCSTFQTRRGPCRRFGILGDYPCGRPLEC